VTPPSRVALVALLAAGALLAACGDKSDVDAAGQTATTTAASTATTTTVADHPATASMDLTTTDGYRYRITLEFGPPSSTGAADCPGTPTPGKVYFPLTLTVANAATDRTAPFPPVRLEQAAPAGIKPGQVQVKDAAGACTSAPRQPSIGPGQSAVFRGNSPAVDPIAPHGNAGPISVKVSETTFDLSVPLP